MIEPVFEDLARSKNRANDVAFVKIDLSVGMSGEVGSEYGVRVTPTFILFLDGNKVGGEHMTFLQQLTRFRRHMR
jgi:hypothetical protein